MSEKAFLVDTTKCIGCGACQVACKEWNNLPAERYVFFSAFDYNIKKNLSAITWCRVTFFNFNSKTKNTLNHKKWDMVHQKCNHCRDANCIKSCPENAIYKVDGWTLINQDKCIACGACEKSCEYKAIHVLKRNYSSDQKMYKAYKCHGCIMNKVNKPLCQQVCPTKAITYDYRLKLIKAAQARLKKVKQKYSNAYLYGLYEYEGLNVLTILKNKPEKYGLPVNTSRKSIKLNKETTELYTLLSIFSFGSKYIKRGIYKFTKLIT